MGDQEDDEVGESDARLLFMFQYLSKSMRFKVDKWHKMMATEENKITVMEFLARAETKRLIFVLAYNGYLSPSDQFPTGSRNKACYFLKKEMIPVTVDNMKNMFIFGDISPKPLDQLAVLVEDVILPMLTSGNNKIRWPKSVAEDVKKRVLDMKDVVFRVKGEVYGRTLLPLPQGIERVQDEFLKLTDGDSRSCDMELRCTIESAVLRWSNQLNEVLKQSSASVFESEVNPVPEAEINFWNQRSKNLCGIYEQLRDPRVKMMATILEKTESAYFPCFQKMFKSVVSAMNEAEEIDRYLRVIVPYITEIQSVPFIETESSFMPLIHNIALIWVHCKYFRTSTKLVILLKEICNLLMQEANKLLDPNSLFECEIEETLPKTRKVLRNLDLFRKIVLLYGEKIVTMFPHNTKAVPWTFDEGLVFERYDKYIYRLKLIKELFETTMEYMKLEKVEVGGNKAHALSLRLNELFENFNNLTASFSSLPYDPTNIDDDNFMDDYQRFKATILDCDRRLAAVACMAFDDCTNFEQIFKMMNVFGGLLVRPVIKDEIEPKYGNIITLFEKEVDTVQNVYHLQMEKYEQRGLMDVPPNWPPVAGAVLWTDSLKKRLLFPLDNINTFGHEITKTERADNVKIRAQELINELDAFREVVFTKWKKVVPSDIEHYLKESLLIVFHNKLIELNFHRQLVAALKEVRYLKLMDVEDLPQEALDLFERNEEFHIWNVTLKKVTECDVINIAIPYGLNGEIKV